MPPCVLRRIQCWEIGSEYAPAFQLGQSRTWVPEMLAAPKFFSSLSLSPIESDRRDGSNNTCRLWPEHFPGRLSIGRSATIFGARHCDVLFKDQCSRDQAAEDPHVTIYLEIGPTISEAVRNKGSNHPHGKAESEGG